MIDMRRAQLKFSDHWVAEEVDGLREDWMKHADRILDDEAILTAVSPGRRNQRHRAAECTEKRPIYVCNILQCSKDTSITELNKDSPFSRPVHRTGRIISHPALSELHTAPKTRDAEGFLTICSLARRAYSALGRRTRP